MIDERGVGDAEGLGNVGFCGELEGRDWVSQVAGKPGEMLGHDILRRGVTLAGIRSEKRLVRSHGWVRGRAVYGPLMALSSPRHGRDGNA